MAGLSGQAIQDTYEAILKLIDNANLTATLKKVTDGAGNETKLELSTALVKILDELLVEGTSASEINLKAGTRNFVIQNNGTKLIIRRDDTTNGAIDVGYYNNNPVLSISSTGRTVARNPFKVGIISGMSEVDYIGRGNWTAGSTNITRTGGLDLGSLLYVRVHNLVTVRCRFNAVHTAAAGAKLTGLPFRSSGSLHDEGALVLGSTGNAITNVPIVGSEALIGDAYSLTGSGTQTIPFATVFKASYFV